MKQTLLVINASARSTRSLSRRLTQRFTDAWLSRLPNSKIIHRDLAASPPPHVTEDWIAAVFTAPEERTDEMKRILAWSDEAIAQLDAAGIIVIGVPMYNYGMPSSLKAWFDQVIRVGKTFTFDLARGDYPLEPIMSGKKLVVLSSRGEFGFGPGGIREKVNHLDPHIATCAHYIGVSSDDIQTISIEYQEFGDERHRQSCEDAESQIDDLVFDLTCSSQHLR
ncbi:NAD(P)H-dependent oxidoreductase [Pelagicoccus sp. SDUM812005]|uniref:FMN-dependent NADH-azoreductase n=1 Tax=Pelagicoccus sp. SDUM812005 TaxID=3041257 RepID=UPI00280D3991|nr:NAD(P)H-dependent oxidoreductase [Pelagicoccus sp. SDUM812005]MDQ8182197.1 NAD(P)H-dependent oxidoreductase [Pelagicoccus sp. SDUM812005]